MLRKRSTQEEIMDDLSIGGEAMARTLHELEIVNKRLGGNAVVRDGMDRILNNLKPDFPKEYFKNNPLTIADLGCGGGDLLKLMAEWARARKLPVNLIGFDANPHVINFAEENSKAYPEIEYHVQDIHDPLFHSRNFDIITCNLFCHHFPEDELVKLLKQWYQQSNHAILINDLHRHWLAYFSIKAITALFSKSYLVKNDAALSVARAFRKKEMVQMLSDAGINNYSLQWKWAFRWQLIIYENKY